MVLSKGPLVSIFYFPIYEWDCLFFFNVESQMNCHSFNFDSIKLNFFVFILHLIRIT